MLFKGQNRSRRDALGILGGACLAAALPSIPFARGITNLPEITNGFNIPLWLDQPDGSMQPPSDFVLAQLLEFGFKTIRLPIDPDRFASDKATVLKASNELVTNLNRLLGFGYSVTLDMHPSGKISKMLEQGSSGDKPLNLAWANIARVAKEFPASHIFLELLNEPQMWRDRWLPLRNQLAKTIRQICPDHTLIWGANKYQSISETIDCPVLEDPNAIVSVHYYSPMAFTHQCQPWGNSPYANLRDLPFPATQNSPKFVAALAQADAARFDGLKQQFKDGWTDGQIENDFNRLGHWAKANGVKVILNEFGALNLCSDKISRANWTRAVREAAQKNNIGWTYWELDRGFGFLDSRDHPSNIDHQMINALLNPVEMGN
ncbi:MAG: cellulase family glycosylhydrolase [Rhizobiaceae bacterium]|nr:cellulase family glycosylhydrolase [Rhizobiaceae bacterium]